MPKQKSHDAVYRLKAIEVRVESNKSQLLQTFQNKHPVSNKGPPHLQAGSKMLGKK